MLVADPLSPLGCGLGPTWIKLVVPAYQTHDQSEKDFERQHLELCQTISEFFFQCGRAHYLAIVTKGVYMV